MSSPAARYFINGINRVTTNHPLSCLGYLFGARLMIFSLGSMTLGTAGILPAQFALAFAVTRPLKRIRFPLDMAGGVALSKAFPVLTEIKVTNLITGPQDPKAPDNPILTRYPSLKAYWEKGNEYINQYGAAYLFARDFVGLASVVLTTLMLSHDPFSITNQLVEWSGVSEDTMSTMTALSGGACLSTVATPILVGSLPIAVDKLVENIDLDSAYKQKMEDLEKKAAEVSKK